MPLSDLRKKDLYNQGYRLVGNHSAIKVCEWCKKSIRGQSFCYKQKFYGINSHQCVQMTPALHVCTHRCFFCWRDIGFTNPKWTGPVDNPKDIVDGCIKEHVKYLQGFGGSKKADKKKFSDALMPKHFAISLSGEPTFYAKLPELIDEIHKRKMTSFLVTNGTNPAMLKRLIKHQPTQLYITLPAPNEDIYKKICNPLIKGGWKKILQSLKLLNGFSCRKAVRLTLVKNENLCNAEDYAKIIKETSADFFEFKAYMWVGYSKKRCNIENMPRYEEIRDFAEKVAKLADLKVIDEKKESRVVLVGKNKIKLL